MDPTQESPKTPDASIGERRSFFAKMAALVIGGIVSVFPLASGLLVFCDPLRRKGDNTGFLRIATLDSLPDDGIPRRFPVIADRTDAWNTYLNEPVGSVFLRREQGSVTVTAFQATCPHMGCYVDYQIDDSRFKCPCHGSLFEPDGARIDPETCPSPRDLDALTVDPERLKQGEIWVDFKNFRAATPERVEIG